MAKYSVQLEELDVYEVIVDADSEDEAERIGTAKLAAGEGERLDLYGQPGTITVTKLEEEA